MDNKLRFEDYIEKNGSLTYTNVGVSMLPLLRQGKDMFIVSKRNGERCRVGDVVLYRRPPDQYVLHRVIEVRSDDVIFEWGKSLIEFYPVQSIKKLMRVLNII